MSGVFEGHTVTGEFVETWREQSADVKYVVLDAESGEHVSAPSLVAFVWPHVFQEVARVSRICRLQLCGDWQRGPVYRDMWNSVVPLGGPHFPAAKTKNPHDIKKQRLKCWWHTAHQLGCGRYKA